MPLWGNLLLKKEAKLIYIIIWFYNQNFINMNTSLKKSDIIEKLIKEIEKLEKDFSEILLNKKNTENELHLFKLEYDSKIAPFYLEKLRIDTKINEILKKRWIPLERFNKGNKYQPETINQESFKEQKEYFENQNTEKDKIEKNIIHMSEEDFVDFKKLYKKLAMKFHPDKFALQPEKQEKALELMKKLNQAFQERDLDMLKKLESEGFDLQYTENKLDEDKLITKKNKLESNIEITSLDIGQIYKSDLYKLYKSYIEQGEEKFYTKIIDEIKNDIIEATQLLNILKEMKL